MTYEQDIETITRDIAVEQTKIACRSLTLEKIFHDAHIEVIA